MTRLIILLALLVFCGCQASTVPSAKVGDPAGAVPSSARSRAVPSALVDRVWTRSDPAGLPGIMRIFLADGTLVQDSCWETYRLSRWQRASDGTLLWQEDGIDIRAEIVALSEQDLVLRMKLRGGNDDEHYRVASVPYVCPDMPR